MPTHVVIIDNYDSFTYNLVQGFAELGSRVTVVLNDAMPVEELLALEPERLVISPGPGQPGACPGPAGSGGTGICGAALEALRGSIPVLGVCLGHQLLALQEGARARRARVPVHGKAWPIHHDGFGIFRGLPNPFPAARYHSRVVAAESLPETLRPLAWSAEGELMGIGVVGEASWGVQFHPESYMTEVGSRLLGTFLSGERCPAPEPGLEKVQSGHE